MADVQISAAAQSQCELRQAPWGAYYANTDDGVAIGIDSAADLCKYVTDDKGVTWTETAIVAGNVKRVACFYDREVPGDTGTLIHVAWLDVDDGTLYYMTVDAADGTEGTIRTVDNTLTVSSTDSLNRVTIGKAKSGRLYIVGSTQTETFAWESDDNFATAATAIADPMEAANQEDWVMLMPADTSDDNDMALVFWDRSANELSIKMLDRSDTASGTWTESSISTGMVDTTQYRNFDCTVRHSDGHLVLAAINDPDTTTGDIKTWDIDVSSIASPTITAGADVVSNTEVALVSLVVNQNNNDIYVAYVTGTWLTTVGIKYHISTDDLSTFGTVQSFSDTDRDYKFIAATRSIGSSGGQVQWVSFVDGDNDAYTNATNSIEITGSTAQAMTASDITSTSSLESPTVAQSQDMTASGISSTSSLESPAVAQSQDMAASDISSASSLETPTADQIHSLEANDISSTSSVEAPSLGFNAGLDASDISSTSSLESPTLTQADNAATASDISSTSSLEEPTAGQIHTGEAFGISSPSALEEPILTQGNPAATASDISSTSSVGQPLLLQGPVVLPPSGAGTSDLRVLINGQDYSLPDNWKQLSFTYNFNGLDTLTQDLPGELIYCGKEPFTALQTEIGEGLCGNISIEVEVKCPPLLPSFEALYEANARLSDVKFTCGRPPCQVSITSTRHNAFTVLEENSTETICLDCENVSTQTDDIRVRQIQSGGVHMLEDGITENTQCFLPIDELISGMIDEVGFLSGNGIANDVWAISFQHHVNRVAIPATTDSQITIIITSEWGTTHTATINFIGGETLGERAELLKKAILARTYGGILQAGAFSPRAHRIFHDISAINTTTDSDVRPAYVAGGAAARSAGELDIITDWPVQSIVASGDVTGTLTVTEVQAYQYGLGDIIFSTNGMASEGICMSWAELKKFMTCVHPTVFIPTDLDFTYAGYDVTFNGAVAGITQPVLNPSSVEWQLREDIIHNKGFFGQQSLLEDVTDAEESWPWYGNKINLHTGLAGISSGPYFRANNGLPANDVIVKTIGAGESGPAFLRGAVIATNNATCAAEVTFQLYRNTATPANLLYDYPTKADISAGATVNLNLGTVIDSSVSPPLNPLLQPSTIVGPEPVCLAVGDQLILRIEVLNPLACTDLGITFSSGPVTNLKDPDWRYEVTEADENFPIITDESSFLEFDPYYDFSDFSNCSGIRDCAVLDKFYTGLGFAITQQLDFLHDYGDTIFTSFRFPAGNGSSINSGDDQTWMWQREWYFNGLGGPPDCYDGRAVSYFFHNMPLQHPWVAAEWAKYVPSNFAVDRYSYDNILTSTGGGNEPTIVQVDSSYLQDGGLVEKAHSRTMLYTFEDCQTLLERIFRGLEKAASFNLCDSGIVSGIIRDMPKQLDGQGLSTFVIEAEDINAL